MSNNYIIKAVEDFNNNGKQELIAKNKELLNSFNSNNREAEYQEYTKPSQDDLTGEQWIEFYEEYYKKEGVNTEDKWITIVEEGNYNLQVSVDESELVTVKSDNGKDVMKLSLYEEDLEKILSVVKEATKG